LKRQIGSVGDRSVVTVDFSETRLVDHTVMERLHSMQREFDERSCVLNITGLDAHASLSHHPFAARKRGRPTPDDNGVTSGHL
jgi:MFS superfamily sulfate permease-like transporter